MLFDTKRLQPLYILASGKPGSSFTFEIARRIGFPEDVIQSAIGKAGKTHLDFEQQLQEVETEKLRLEKRLKEFQVADGFLGVHLVLPHPYRQFHSLSDQVDDLVVHFLYAPSDGIDIIWQRIHLSVIGPR